MLLYKGYIPSMSCHRELMSKVKMGLLDSQRKNWSVPFFFWTRRDMNPLLS